MPEARGEKLEMHLLHPYLLRDRWLIRQISDSSLISLIKPTVESASSPYHFTAKASRGPADKGVLGVSSVEAWELAAKKMQNPEPELSYSTPSGRLD